LEEKMRTGKELIGHPIYSITDGRHLGNVKDLYLNEELTRLQGLFIGQEGLLRKKAILIPMDSVAILGQDAVLATGPEVVTDSREQPSAQEWLRREDLQGRDVDTAGGTKVGVVGDVLLDGAQIVGFTLSKVHVSGPMAESREISRGVLIDTGGEDSAMTIDLTMAERQGIGQPADLATSPVEIEDARYLDPDDAMASLGIAPAGPDLSDPPEPPATF
jgi:uncharacterized protein YrrD